MKMRTLLCTVTLFCLCISGAQALTIPSKPTGFVSDQASALLQEQKGNLESILERYRQETSNEIAVLILPSLEGEVAADLAVNVGRQWGVGSSEFDNGILMLIATEDKELFIATGYGLEGAVPDIVAKGIIEEDIVPFFRNGQYYEGIMSGIMSLQKHIGGEYTADRYKKESNSSSGQLLFFLIFFGFQWLVAILGRTKSWWLGGVIGGVIGAVLTGLLLLWWTIPVLAALGLLLDYIVSKNYKANRKTAWWAGGGWGPGSGGGGGGFGGFGGGGFGGGGAGGKW